MSKYELVVVLPGNLQKENNQKLTAKVKKVVSDLKAVIESEVDWGVRKLSYPIKQNTLGHYLIWKLDIPVSSIKEMKRLLNFETDLLRYMLLKVDTKKE
jgi:small subunit ribosomal protein S6